MLTPKPTTRATRLKCCLSLLCQMLTTHTCSYDVSTKHLNSKGPHLENKYCTTFCPFSLASVALDYWHLSTLAKSFQSHVRIHFSNTLSAAILYSSANGAPLDQHLPIVLLNSIMCLVVGATDWFGSGSLSFLHWKKKYSISHPS